MAENSRPIWLLADGCTPIALGSLKKKRFPPGVTHWCHEGDEKWTVLTHEDRERLEKRRRGNEKPVVRMEF
jgi:hypothetical protein